MFRKHRLGVLETLGLQIMFIVPRVEIASPEQVDHGARKVQKRCAHDLFACGTVQGMTQSETQIFQRHRARLAIKSVVQAAEPVGQPERYPAGQSRDDDGQQPTANVFQTVSNLLPEYSHPHTAITLAAAMHKERILDIVRALLSRPTAPFHEAEVRTAIRGLLAGCAGMTLAQDEFGNLIAHYQGQDGAETGAPVYAFCAHMDHPGWVAPGGAADRQFLGGVPESYLAANRERVRDFGDFAMWDLPECDLRDGRIHSRACDDLIGCAVIVATLQGLSQSGFGGECYGLFTRAEEVGFAGAIAMAKDRWLRDAGITVISLETSAERPPARMGAGPIIRVGDKQSVFDHQVTAELVAAAAEADIPAQRCLMSGGTCEATAFRLYGVRCGAMCVALGNYHNCGPDNRIEAEFVSLEDVAGLAALCARLVERPGPGPETDAAFRERLESRLTPYEPYYHRDRGASPS